MELIISQLHFIRPAWFYAFIPLVLVTLALLRLNKQGKSWTNIIDPKLLPHLLVGQSIKKVRKTVFCCSLPVPLRYFL